MGFKRFSILVSVRIGLLALSLFILALTIVGGRYPVATLLLSLVVLLQTAEVIRFVRKTNNELRRFLDSARYADFSQRFSSQITGSGFEELNRVFSDILKRFEENRHTQEQELRYLKALIEHVPVPSLSIHADGSVSFNNNAARRLFGNMPVTRIEHFEQFSSGVSQLLTALPIGQRDLVTLKIDDLEKQFTVAAAQVSVGERVVKLVSLQDIQPELDEAQLDAWQALVRVLTHEIMNSITPISSLAATTTDMIRGASEQATQLDNSAPANAIRQELEDVQEAVDTIAHRSDSLTQFVQSYRKLTRLPQPNRQLIKLVDLFDSIKALMASEADQAGVTIESSLTPGSLELIADRDMLEQVLINLLRNSLQAIEACNTTIQGKVDVIARINKRGNIVIEVEDNGPGINNDIVSNVFVPFFTTKREGSGVGLALTRQIMTAHGGTVSIGELKTDVGTRILLTF
ncbi:MAG: PAS domain-containing sensor histidine kinase [Pseudomonadales bacterium]